MTKDEDIEAMAFVFAPPGKVILIKLGNCHTDRVEEHLREKIELIRAFLASKSETLMAIP